jgi:signal transduction histidine kinase
MTDINKGRRKLFVIEELDSTNRINSEGERYHSTLDMGYSIAAWIGFFATIFVLVTIFNAKPFQAAFFFNAIVTFLLFVNGVAGFYFHYKRRLFSELMTLPSVIIGLGFVLIAYIIQTIHQMLQDETVSVVSGISGAFIMVFIFYLFARYRFILKIIKEAKINKNLIEKIEAN